MGACKNALQWFLDENIEAPLLHDLYTTLHREVFNRYVAHGEKRLDQLQELFDLISTHPCSDLKLLLDMEDQAKKWNGSLVQGENFWHDAIAKAQRNSTADEDTLRRSLDYLKVVPPDFVFSVFCRAFAQNDEELLENLLMWKKSKGSLKLTDLLHFNGPNMLQSCRKFFPDCIDKNTNRSAIQKIQWKCIHEMTKEDVPSPKIDDLMIVMQENSLKENIIAWKIDRSHTSLLNHTLVRLCENKHFEEASKILILMFENNIPLTATSIKRAVSCSFHYTPHASEIWNDVLEHGEVQFRQEKIFEMKQINRPDSYLVLSSDAGRLLGQKGENLKRIRQESGAWIRIENSHKMKHSSHRLLVITGTAEQKKLALELIQNSTELQDKPQAGEILNYRQKLECITDGFLSSGNIKHCNQWFKFIKEKDQDLNVYKLVESVINMKISRCNKFGLLQSLHVLEHIFSFTFCSSVG